MLYPLELLNIDDTVINPIMTEIAGEIASDLMINDRNRVRNASEGNVNVKREYAGTISRWSVNSDRYTVDIASVEVIDPTRVVTAGVGRPMTTPIFADPQREIAFNPQYIPAQYDLTITVNTQSHSEAKHIQSRLTTLVGMGRQMKLTEVEYYYLLPPSVLSVMNELGKHISPEDPMAWARDKFTTKLQMMSAPGGNQTLPAIRENQTQVLIQYLYQERADVDVRSVEESRGRVSFQCRLYFDVPHSILVKHPTVIDHKPVSKALRADVGRIDNTGVKDTGSTSTHLKSALGENGVKYGMLTYPKEDDWLPARYHAYVTPFFSAAVSLDPNDHSALFNVSDLDGVITFPDELKAFMRQEHENLTTIYKSLIYVTLYRNDEEIYEGVVIDSDLNIRSGAPMKEGYAYRVVFFIMLAPNMMPEDYRYRMVMYPDLVERYLKGLGITYSEFPKVNRLQLIKWWEYLNVRYLKYPNDKIGVFAPVDFTILT